MVDRPRILHSELARHDANPAAEWTARLDCCVKSRNHGTDPFTVQNRHHRVPSKLQIPDRGTSSSRPLASCSRGFDAGGVRLLSDVRRSRVPAHRAPVRLSRTHGFGLEVRSDVHPFAPEAVFSPVSTASKVRG
jgi:hypothetical protein